MSTKLTVGKKYRISDTSGNVLIGIAINDSEVALTGFLTGYMGQNRILNARHMYRCDASVVSFAEEQLPQDVSSTESIISALQILAVEVNSEDGVANAAIAEASNRLAELNKEIKELRSKCN